MRFLKAGSDAAANDPDAGAASRDSIRVADIYIGIHSHAKHHVQYRQIKRTTPNIWQSPLIFFL